MKKNKVFVSFIGSRGSGKTTIADALTKNLSKSQTKVLRQHQGLSSGISIKGLWNAITLWRYFDPEIVKKIGFCGRPARKLPSLYRLYLPLAFSKDLFDLGRKGDVLIYDSNFLRGMLQAVLQKELQVTQVVDFYQRKILSNLDEVIIVVVVTDPRLAIARWISRDKVNISDEEIEKEILIRQYFQNATDKFVTELAKSPKVKVIWLEGDELPKANAMKIISRCDKFNKGIT